MTSNSATYETILVEQRGAVTLMTLNRPQALNALNSQMLADVEFTNFRTDTKDSIYHEPALTGYPGVLAAKSVHSLGAKR